MNLAGYLVSQGIALLMIMALVIAERYYPAVPQAPAQKRRLNLEIYALGVSLGPAYALLFLISSSHIGGIFDLGRITNEFHGASKLVGVLIAVLIWKAAKDFFFYWFHRFQHSSFLWQQHKLHHLDEYVDTLTTGRNHWLEGALAIPARFIPLAILFKFDRTDGAVAGGFLGFLGLVDTFWSLANHANLRIGFGRFSWLLSSPQQHRIHHSRLPQHQNKNFAVLFPIWDMIFGTYYHPKQGEYPPSGVEGENDVNSFRDAALLPFKEWTKSWQRAWAGWKLPATGVPFAGIENTSSAADTGANSSGSACCPPFRSTPPDWKGRSLGM